MIQCLRLVEEADMARPCGIALRRRVVAAIDEGMSARAAAARFSVAPSPAIKWHQQWRTERSLEPARLAHPPGSKRDAFEGFIRGLTGARKNRYAQTFTPRHPGPDIQAQRQEWFDSPGESIEKTSA